GLLPPRVAVFESTRRMGSGPLLLSSGPSPQPFHQHQERGLQVLCLRGPRERRARISKESIQAILQRIGSKPGSLEGPIMNPQFVWSHRDTRGRVIGEIRRFVPGRNGKPKEDIPFYRFDGRDFGPGIPDDMKHTAYPLFGIETVIDK